MRIKLLGPVLGSLRNRYHSKDSSAVTARRDLLLALVAAITVCCIYVIFNFALASTQKSLLFQEVVPVKMIEMISFAFFSVLLLSSTIAAVSSLYYADSNDFHLSMPISTGQLYFYKLLSVVWETGVMLVVFGVPCSLAFIVSLDLPLSFLLTACALAFPLVIIPSGLSFALATLFTFFFTKLWRQGQLLILVFGASGLYLLSELIFLARQPAEYYRNRFSLFDLVDLFGNVNPSWLPSRWISDLLVGFLDSPVSAHHEKGLLLAATTVLAVSIGYLCFELAYLKTRSNVQISSSAKAKSYLGLFRRLKEFLLRVSKQPQSVAIAWKDLTSTVRDHGRALQLILFCGFSFAYLLVFKISGIALSLSGDDNIAVWKAFLASMNYLFVGFLTTAVMTRLVYPSISLEGRSLWVVLVAPINIEQLVKAKFWAWLPLTALFSTTLLVLGSLTLDLSAWTLIPQVLLGLSLAYGATGLAIGLGAQFASFEWESPSQVTSGLGTLLLLLSSLGMVLASFVPASIAVALSSSPFFRRSASNFIENKLALEWSLGVEFFWAYLLIALSLLLVITIQIGIGVQTRKIGAASLLKHAVR